MSQRGERQGLSVWTLAWLVTTTSSASLLSITATSTSLAPSSLSGSTHPAVPLPTACGNSDAARTRHLREQRGPQLFHTAHMPVKLLRYPAVDVCPSQAGSFCCIRYCCYCCWALTSTKSAPGAASVVIPSSLKYTVTL